MKSIDTSQSGFTLIEALIYIAIVGIVLVAFVQFILAISNTRNKSYVIQEVQANSRIVLDVIARQIRAATDVVTTTSAFGVDPSTIVLSMPVPSQDPTVITVVDNTLVIKQGASSTTTLTSDRVKVIQFLVDHVDDVRSIHHDSLRVNMTIEYDAQDKSFEYQDTVQTAIYTRQ